MITKEKTKEFIDRAYKCACEHGFHDKELSIEHFLMLVITEISEAVEADRKNLKAKFGKYEKELNKYEKLVDYDTRFKCAFEKFVKNSVEDELADVCIRLYDMCGAFDIEPLDDAAIKEDLLTDKSFCERCYYACTILSSYYVAGETPRSTVSFALKYIMLICDGMGIDLERHIELKMQYNEQRPKLHGKRY